MKNKKSYAKIRLVLGLVSVVTGILATNLALFHWIEQTGFYHLLGEYARYVCAYGGFGAMIFGSMLVNDVLFHMKRETSEEVILNMRATPKKEKRIVRKAPK